MDDSSAIKVGGVQLSIEMSLFVAACVAALIAVVGKPGSVSVGAFVFAVLGLVPWVLEVRGRRLNQMLFLAMTIIPAAVLVIVVGNPGGLFPAMISVVWVTRRSSRAVVTIGVVAAAGMTIACALLRPSEFEGEIYFLGGIGVSWLAGMLLRRQTTLVDEIREAAERERQHAAVEERTRIAREVHDVIAHSLTVTILNVTGARRALTNDPQRAAAALERAEAIGRESLDSIRQVVGLLRDPNGVAKVFGDCDERPLPQISDIPTLIAQFRDGGMRVDAVFEVGDVDVGAMTSLAAFRLLQEAMTNALQHAPGKPVSLRVVFNSCDAAIHVEVENQMGESMPQRRPGLGLIGMAERVRTAGGSIKIGPTADDTWLVVADLPVNLVKEPL